MSLSEGLLHFKHLFVYMYVCARVGSCVYYTRHVAVTGPPKGVSPATLWVLGIDNSFGRLGDMRLGQLSHLTSSELTFYL